MENYNVSFNWLKGISNYFLKIIEIISTISNNNFN